MTVQAREDLAHRLAVAYMSYFLRVSYQTAEKNYVPKNKPVGSFWLSVADFVIESMKPNRQPVPVQPGISLEDATTLWRAKGFTLLGYLWVNEADSRRWTISFNPETKPELRDAWVKISGRTFSPGNLADDFKQEA